MSNTRLPNALQGAVRPHVVAICGSRRDGSYTRCALVEVMSTVEATGATGELLDLSQVDLPPLEPDHSDVGGGADMTRRIREADAIVLGTPTYHDSYSGVLKNTLDYCGFDEFDGTIVGLLVVSGGPFPTTALNHLRAVCRALHAWVLPRQVAIPNASRMFDDEGFADDALRERVHSLGERIVRYASIEPEPPRAIVSRGV